VFYKDGEVPEKQDVVCVSRGQVGIVIFVNATTVEVSNGWETKSYNPELITLIQRGPKYHLIELNGAKK